VADAEPKERLHEPPAAISHDPEASSNDVELDMPIDPSLDPLSSAYRDAVMAHYWRLMGTNRAAPPAADPAGIDPDHDLVVRPWPYSTGAGSEAGQFLQAIGFIIATCRLRRGHRVLQMGVGIGGLPLPLARLGCPVTMLDPDAHGLAVLRQRAERAGLVLRIVQANFADAADALDGQKFDFVVFHNTFHRSGDHLALLRLLRERLLAPGGRLVLAGEPLLEAAPFPWGLDPGSGSISTMRQGGGPVLVFRTSYLMQALEATGYDATLSVCQQTALGNVVLAVRQ
jgi:SAM-dependent methyltransferase